MGVDLGLIAPVKDGEVVSSSASTNSISNSHKQKNDLVSSDTFLQLLVAEMQNQDPLEPTSNTDWIAQYATFTQVSEIQGIGKDMESMSAQGLVGKEVVLNVEDAKGNREEVTGVVDYVTYEENKAYLSIEGKLYSASDLVAVLGAEYQEARRLAQDIADALKELPEIEELTIAHKNAVVALKAAKEGMTQYQEKFADAEMLAKVDKYYSKMVDLVEAYNEKLAAAEAIEKENAEKEAANNVSSTDKDTETAGEENETPLN